MKKKYGKIKGTWEEVAAPHGISGEKLRDMVKKFQKKKGTLPSKPKDTELLNELELKKIELKKEKIKLQDQKNAFNKIIREISRSENIIEEIKKSIEESELPKLKPFIVKNKKNNFDNELLSLWSDFHYGATADNFINKYNPEIFKVRFWNYIYEIVKIGQFHNANKLHIFMLGDLISGMIHSNIRVTNAENVIKQTQEVSEIMALAIYHLSEYFDDIQIHYVLGNHGRVFQNKDESIEGENFEQFIYWYLKARLENLTGVNINDNVFSDIIYIDICGYRVAGVHGDKDSPNSVVSNISLMLGEVPDYIAIGHKHHFYEVVEQGVNVIGSGSLMSVDEYAKNIRKTGYACQTVCVFGQDGKECTYNVRLS